MFASLLTVAQGALPHKPHLPCAFTILVATSVYECDGPHCCAVMALWNHISTTMIYVMWRQEHLWKITVLQRGHIFSLIIVFIICVFAIVFSWVSTLRSALKSVYRTLSK